MKRITLLFFAFIISTMMMAQKKETVFEVASNIAKPITVETGSGGYTVYGTLKIDGWTRVDRAFDANGNQIVVPLSHSTTKGVGNNRIQTTTYTFKTLYNTASSSTTSSKQYNRGDNRMSKDERRERREERTRASIEANWFALGQKIDLGLPSGNIWSGYNLGAESALETGDFYTWGGIETLSQIGSASVNGYFDNNNTIFSLNGQSRLTREYDAVYQEWGGNWQIPTADDFRELIDCCDWRNGTINGVKGFQGTGPNGTKIFFPVVGSCLDGSWDNEMTGYWASDLYNDGGEIKGGIMACVLWEDMENNFYSAYPRNGFQQIRPVWKNTPVKAMPSQNAKNTDVTRNANTQPTVAKAEKVVDYVYPSGNKYTGELLNGVPHGKGKMIIAGSGKIYEGEFANDHLMKGKIIDGTWVTIGEWNEKGDPVTGSHYERHTPEYVIKSQIEYFLDMDYCTGKTTINFKNGMKFDGELDLGLPSKGTLTLPDGTKYVGDFKEISKSNGKFYDSKGRAITEEQWEEKFTQEYHDALYMVW